MMKEQTVALIACSKSKADRKMPAAELYTGQLFRLQLRYAREVLELPDDRIFILSALHGLVALSDELEPYNHSLSDMKAAERREWGRKVAHELSLVRPPISSAYIMAGRMYRDPVWSRFWDAGNTMWNVVPSSLGYAAQATWYRRQLAGS